MAANSSSSSSHLDAFKPCSRTRNHQKLKEIYPDVQILPLDYDPDVSFANIENRLQMLVMNAKQAKRRVSVVQKKENKKETVKKGKIHKQESYC